MGLNYGGLQPTWFCQLLDNEILEGNSLMAKSVNSAPGDSSIAVTGQQIPGLPVAMARCTVVRHNHLHSNARIELTGTVKDVVVEHNTIENASIGMKVEKTVAGALVRENKFVNVHQPFAT